MVQSDHDGLSCTELYRGDALSDYLRDRPIDRPKPSKKLNFRKRESQMQQDAT